MAVNRRYYYLTITVMCCLALVIVLMPDMLICLLKLFFFFSSVGYFTWCKDFVAHLNNSMVYYSLSVFYSKKDSISNNVCGHDLKRRIVFFLVLGQ